MVRYFTVLALVLLCVASGWADVAVRMERIDYANPGDQVSLSVNLDDSTGVFQTGGYDFRILYDTNLTLSAVHPGQMMADCGWEYLTYSQPVPYEVTLTAIADLNNGSAHPVCFGGDIVELASLDFSIPLNLNLQGEFLTVRFKWYDCGDNAISSRFGDTLYFSDSVYHFDGVLEYPITRDTTLPSLFGAPSSCAPYDSPYRAVDFYNGGISLSAADIEPPVAHCPGDITVYNDPAVCGAEVHYQATVTDNRPGAIMACTPRSGSIFPVGITDAACVAVDASGNQDTCWFTVTVIDTQTPAITCPDDTLVMNDPDRCEADVYYDVTVQDNCSGASWTALPPSGSSFPIGTTPVRVVANDRSGNSDTAWFDITVSDDQPPEVPCSDDFAVANDPDQCGAVVSFPVAVSDNCPTAQVFSTPPSGSFFPLGSTEVEIVGRDWIGLADTCRFVITVTDTQPPIISHPADTIVAAVAGACQAWVDFEVSATDNCDSVSILTVPPPGIWFPLGSTPIEIVATDQFGLADTSSFTVTVVDSQPPVLNCPSALTVPADPGQCGAVVTLDVSATDNCSEPSIAVEPPSGSFFPAGTTFVSATAIDDAGNDTSCVFPVIVTDTEAPSIECPNDITSANDPGEYGAIVEFSISAADNCSPVTTTVDPPSGSFFPVGSTLVTVTVRDAADNVSYCNFTVTVDLSDSDGDGIPDLSDNCPDTANTEQADSDADGTGDACCCLNRGDVDNNAAVNVTDLTMLVAYLFEQTASLPCPEQANADGSVSAGNTINVADITFLVEFLFRAGPPPPPCP